MLFRWLGDAKLPLPDLNTSHPVVRQELQAYVKAFVGEYNVDGLRIDAAKHVEPSFWPSFCNENGAAGVFCIGEVYGPDVGYACSPVYDWSDNTECKSFSAPSVLPPRGRVHLTPC